MTTEKSLIDIEEIGLRNCLIQIKGEGKLVFWVTSASIGPLVEARTSPAKEGR